MDERLTKRLQVYVQPPACRVPLAAVAIAFLNAREIQCGVVTASGESFDGHIHVDSRFSVQSITKSFTAAVILRLVATDRLMLDAFVSEWLPDVPNASRITIRQCLQHTSGLPDYGILPEYH
jgi:D-alanyl-D-alanine carboxypeptidase